MNDDKKWMLVPVCFSLIIFSPIVAAEEISHDTAPATANGHPVADGKRGAPSGNNVTLSSSTNPFCYGGGDQVFFHWGKTASNAWMLSTANYPGASDHDTQLATAAPVAPNESLMAAFRTSYSEHGHPDTAGAGIYVSGDPTDTMTYGPDLMVFHLTVRNQTYAMNADSHFRAKSDAALSSGDFSQLPPITNYSGCRVPPAPGLNWYVISRPAQDSDGISLEFGPPSASDVDRFWMNGTMGKSRSEQIAFLRKIADAIRYLPQDPTMMTKSSADFFRGITFDKGFPLIQSLIQARDLSDRDLANLALILGTDLKNLPNDSRTLEFKNWLCSPTVFPRACET